MVEKLDKEVFDMNSGEFHQELFDNEDAILDGITKVKEDQNTESGVQDSWRN